MKTKIFVKLALLLMFALLRPMRTGKLRMAFGFASKAMHRFSFNRTRYGGVSL
jgi:hypothetical protein